MMKCGFINYDEECDFTQVGKEEGVFIRTGEDCFIKVELQSQSEFSYLKDIILKHRRIKIF